MPTETHALARAPDARAWAEALGTAFLLAGIVGSGIMGERLAGGNVAIALLANSLATGALLVALLLVLGPLSGAHLNPAVTLVAAWNGTQPWRDARSYLAAQVLGALAGVAVAHAMFGEDLFALSRKARTGPPQLVSEFVATFGLLLTILGCARSQPRATPFAVGAYITSAYWFTGSTSFANPAVTLARALTDTFSGIRPADVLGFLLAQAAGAGAAALLWRRLTRSPDTQEVRP